jgi:membrane protein implicated in regulation of membrane protease activity
MRRIASALICAGVLLWVLGVAAWIIGVWITLPPDTVRVMMLTLAGLAGGVLLVTGAVVARATRRRDDTQARPAKVAL